MNQRWVATGIAVVLSIPLVPYLITGIEHLTGTDVPIVVTDRGWKLESHGTDQSSEPILAALPNRQRTSPTITAVQDAASNTPNIAQGSIFIVKGTNLSAPGYTPFGPPRPTVSSGVKVTLTTVAGGAVTDAYLVYLYNKGGVNQIACILPSAVAVGYYKVTVTSGTVSAPVVAQVVANKAALFTQDSSGSGMASVQNYISAGVVDLNRLTPGAIGGITISRAKPGQAIIAYGAGLGAYAAGDNSTSPVFDFRSSLAIQAVVGGVTIPDHAGCADYTGEHRLNFTQPTSIPTGCAMPLQSGGWSLATDLRGDSRSTIDVGVREDTRAASGNVIRAKASIPPNRHNVKTVGRGWYALDLREFPQTDSGPVDLEFKSNDGEHKRFSLAALPGKAGRSVALMYFNRPGSLAIVASDPEEEPTVDGVGYAEIVKKFGAIAAAKAELTVELLCDILPMAAWILVVCLLQAATYWAIRKLPRTIRRDAEHEIHLMLFVAKWAGVGCYAVLAVKTMLGQVGIMLVR